MEIEEGIASVSFLNKYIKKYYKPFIAAIFCLTTEAMCDLFQPTVMSRIVDVGVARRDMDYVVRASAVMLLVTALGALGAVGRNILAGNVSQRFGRDLRNEIFRKIQSFSFDNIDRFETGSLIVRLTNDVTQVQNFANSIMRIFVRAPLLCIGSIIMAVLLSPPMSVILIGVVPVVGTLIFLSMRIGYPYFAKVQRALDSLNSVMREYLSGVRVVKAFNRFDYEVERFSGYNEGLSKVSTVAMRVMAAFNPSIALTVNIGIVAVLWLGGIRVDGGSLQVGKVIAFINYMTQILFSLNMISFIFTNFVRAKASCERIGEVLSAENAMKECENPKEAFENTGSVEFKNVSFAYPDSGGALALRDVSFVCGPGDTIGIIGSTGSGKSTLVNLIPRFYDATAGEVLVNGVNVKDMDIRRLRDIIAVVPQKNVLFTGTIEENLRWGREDADMEDIKKAAAVAQADKFINSFPEGYNTLLGRGGVNLSGGQKQRLSIARALLKRPQILILDDSTSAVDVVTEGRIRQGLREFSKGLTCFIIAQRITSVMGADKILVMDNGEIVGAGTHGELMESCDVYRDIYLSQIGKEGL